MKHRTLQMRFVETPKIPGGETGTESVVDYGQVVTNGVQDVVAGVVIVLVVRTVLNTVSEIAISRFS